jgi:phage baseplate assembly protein W
MARTVYQYQPVNDTPDVSIGILLPMNKSADRYDYKLTAISGSTAAAGQQYNNAAQDGGSVFALSYSTDQQAISNLQNLLLTSKGERYMQPDFGTRIRESIFQQNTEALQDYLPESLTADIQRWLPYITINDVLVNRRVDSHAVDIQVRFKITNYGANLTINIMADENRVVLTDISADEDAGLVAVGTFGDSFAAGNY